MFVDTEGSEVSCEVFVTARVIVVIASDDLEHLKAARREQEIMPAAGVFVDFQHGLALVGVERMTRAQKN